MTPAGMTVFLAAEPVDMRRSFAGLALWVQTQLGMDAKARGTMYVFVNRRRDMAKVLWRDGTGWCLLAKRLDERIVALPANIPEGASSVTVDARALAALLDGVVRRRSETARSIARAARDAAEKTRAMTMNSENAVTTSAR
jgi:transposase